MKFQKTKTRFCRWKSTDNNDINIFLSLENPCTFLLAKEKTWKRIFNTNSELSQNRTEKQIMPSKTTVNWLFNDIWCYLFITCFDWKIGVFQQTAAKIYYILKEDLYKIDQGIRQTKLLRITLKTKNKFSPAPLVFSGFTIKFNLLQSLHKFTKWGKVKTKKKPVSWSEN